MSQLHVKERRKIAAPVTLFLERLFAPRMMRPMYADELARLESYAKQQIKK